MTGQSRRREAFGDPTAREWAEALVLRQRMDADTGDPAGGIDVRERTPGAGAEPSPPPPPAGDRTPPAEDEPDGTAEPLLVVDAPATSDRPPRRPHFAPAGASAPQIPAEHPGLRDTLAVSRALRWFNRRWTDPRERALDEEATAVRSVQLGRWDPVLAGVSGAWLDVALVVEHSASMVLWRGVGRKVAALLDRQGAFRDVRVWRLDTWGSKEAVLYSERGTTVHDPAELLHPEGRRLVLVLSDCASDAWAGGAVPRMLLGWAGHQPVAVLNPLPSRLWHDTQAVPVDVRLRARAAGSANARLDMQGAPPYPRPDTGDGCAPDPDLVPVPVLEIEPEWLAGWARMVAGASAGWTPASVLLVDRHGLRMPWPAEPSEPQAPGTPAELVRRFLTSASPAAQRLATRLAMVPLTLQVMQAEQMSLLPRAGILPLAEIMLGGLLEQVGPAPGPAVGDRKAERGPVFEFIDGVRAQLLGRLGRTEIFRALPVASAIAAKALGARDDLARRLLSTPDEVYGTGLSAPEQRLVGAMQPAFVALGAAYGPVAERAGRVAEGAGRGAQGAGRARQADGGDAAGRQQTGPARRRTPTVAGRPDASAAPSRHAVQAAPAAGSLDQAAADAEQSVPASGAAGSTDSAPERTSAMDGAPRQLSSHTAEHDTDPAGSSSGSGSAPNDGPAGPGSSAARRSAGDAAAPGRVPRPGAYFTGREEELRQLRSALSEGVRAALLPQALYGLGGVGKTQLALEYVRRHAGDYELVWWVQAEQPAVIRESLAALAPRLGVEDTDVKATVDRVIKALESGQPVKRWLLVFDNAGAPEDVQHFLPYMAGVQDGLGHVIVTSRNASWSDSVPSLRIDVFPRGESVEFLRRRAPGMSDAEAGRMAFALGDLPLALEQAAAMKVKSGLTVDQYLDLLESQGDRVRRVDASAVPGIQSVSKVWQVSMRDLQKRNPGALELLRFLAFFGPDPVQQSFLHDARLLGFPQPLASVLRDPIARSRAITETGRYSLLNTDVGTVQLHRLMRNVLQDELTGEASAEMRYRVHQALAAHDPGDPQASGNWDRYREVLPHVRPSGMLESDDQEARWTVINVARYLFAKGDFQSSVELCRETVDTWTERLGEDHLQTLVARRRLAAALWQLGSYEEAGELNRVTLQRLRNTVGEDHEEYLALAGLMAAGLRVTGDFREALELDRSAFEHSVRLYGRDDSASLTSGHNYSVSLRMSGRFAEAYELDSRTSEIYLRTLGPTSQLSLLAINNVARDMRELGRYRESVQLQERTVARYRRHYGDTHQDTLRAIKNLSVSYRKAGDRERGLETAREVLANYPAAMGENHIDTLAARANIANDLRLTGDPEGARRAGADALSRYRTGLGPEHPFTFIAAVNQGAALRSCGEFLEARRLDEETVAGMAAALWDEHVWVQIARINLATGLAASGDPAAAAALGRQAADILQSQYGDSHPHTLAALRNVALDLEANGEQDAADDLMARVRRRYRATLGDRHPETRNAMAGLRAECDLEPPPI